MRRHVLGRGVYLKAYPRHTYDVHPAFATCVTPAFLIRRAASAKRHGGDSPAPVASTALSEGNQARLRKVRWKAMAMRAMVRSMHAACHRELYRSSHLAALIPLRLARPSPKATPEHSKLLPATPSSS